MSVDRPTGLKKNWELTQAAFETLLARLDADRERAGEKYEAARRKLINFFRWWGSESPEDHADEALNRVVRKVSEGEVIENLDAYILGVARLLFKEHLKDQNRRRAALERAPRDFTSPEDQAAREARLDCYEHCLEELPPESRELMVRYYRNGERKKSDQREALARQLGIQLNLLRIRAFRIRNKLADCVRRCLGRKDDV